MLPGTELTATDYRLCINSQSPCALYDAKSHMRADRSIMPRASNNHASVACLCVYAIQLCVSSPMWYVRSSFACCISWNNRPSLSGDAETLTAWTWSSLFRPWLLQEKLPTCNKVW